MEGSVETKNDIFTNLFKNRALLLQPNAYITFNFRYFNKTTRTNEVLPSVDAGGPTKTVFLNLSELFNDSSYEYFNLFFVNPNNILTLNEVQRNNNEKLEKVKFLGSLFGLCLRLRQNIFSY